MTQMQRCACCHAVLQLANCRPKCARPWEGPARQQGELQTAVIGMQRRFDRQRANIAQTLLPAFTVYLSVKAEVVMPPASLLLHRCKRLVFQLCQTQLTGLAGMLSRWRSVCNQQQQRAMCSCSLLSLGGWWGRRRGRPRAGWGAGTGRGGARGRAAGRRAALRRGRGAGNVVSHVQSGSGVCAVVAELHVANREGPELYAHGGNAGFGTEAMPQPPQRLC